jgi:hypothetical protein
MEKQYVVNSLVIGHNKMKTLQKLHEDLWLAIMLRSFWNAFDTKDPTNGKKPIGTFGI